MGIVKTVLLVLMAAAYIAAGANHFLNPDFYVRVMPPYLPAHLFLVYLSGVCEVVGGLLLLVPRTRAFAAWGIIAMLLVFMLVHVHMATHPVSYPDVPQGALLARIPTQALLIAWACWYTGNARTAR